MGYLVSTTLSGLNKELISELLIDSRIFLMEPRITEHTTKSLNSGEPVRAWLISWAWATSFLRNFLEDLGDFSSTCGRAHGSGHGLGSFLRDFTIIL